VDKILPELQDADEVQERRYYKRNGIRVKKEFVKDVEREKNAAAKRAGRNDGEDRDDEEEEEEEEEDGGAESGAGAQQKEAPPPPPPPAAASALKKTSYQLSPSSPKKSIVPPDELNVELHPDQGDEGKQEPKKKRAAKSLAAHHVVHIAPSPAAEPKRKKSNLASLVKPLIRASGRLKIGQLKKYLVSQLKLADSSKCKLEVRCNGDAVGDELSLTFIQRTRWLAPERDMILTYHLVEERVY